jgi:hypothetical protein
MSADLIQHASALPAVKEISLSTAGWWFSRRPTWTRRHVVTMNLNSDCDASMEVVIDIVLPREEGASWPWANGKRLYVVPLVLVTKQPQLAQIKLTDEAGDMVHLFTRQDNERISCAGLELALDRLLGDRADEREATRLKAVLRGSTTNWDRPAELYLALAREWFLRLEPRVRRRGRYEHLRELADDLSASTMVWVPMVGLPGQQRSFRLESHIQLHVPSIRYPVVRRLLTWRMRTLGVEESIVVERGAGRRSESHQYRLKATPPDDANSRGSLRRIWNRAADTVGFTPYHLRMEAPYMKRTCSYHLQVNAPPAVDVRVMRLHPDPGSGGRVYEALTANHGHLYFSKASSIRSQAAALVNLRVNRRGPLFYSALTATLIAGLLWFFVGDARYALKYETATASTLLIVPGLLNVLVSRLGEHALVTRLLSGVRMLMLVSGACSVAAAAGVAGVWPFGEGHKQPWENMAYNWEIEAKLATAVALVLIWSWLLAFGGLESIRKRMRAFCSEGRRYTRLAVVMAAIPVVALLTMPGDNDTLGVGSWCLAALMGLGGGLCAWGAAYGEENNQYASSTILAVLGLVSVATLVVFLGLDRGWIGWSKYASIAKPAIAVFVVGGFLYQFAAAKWPESSAQ